MDPFPIPPPPPKNRRLEADFYFRVGVYTFITLRATLETNPFTQSSLAAMVVTLLREEASRLACHLHAYCLMPDHLHDLISPAQEGVSVLRFTDRFKGKSTHYSWKVGWQGRLWQPRSYDHILRGRRIGCRWRSTS